MEYKEQKLRVSMPLFSMGIRIRCAYPVMTC